MATAAKTGAAEGAPELTAHTAPPRPGSDRAFGLVFAVVFAIIGVMPFLTARYVRPWALIVSAAFLLTASLKPGLLAPLNHLWLRVGLLLNRIISPLALLVVFCVAVLPTGLLMRALGKDSLRRKMDSQAASYWIERTPPARPDAQMKKQF